MSAKERRIPKRVEKALLKYAGIALVLLLIAGFIEAGALIYGRAVNRLDREGIITLATVLAVEQFEEAADADLNTDAYDIVTLVDYSFEAENGVTITDQYRSENLDEIPQVGSPFSVRYAASDPSFHEARVGAKASNLSALHWIAAFWAVLAVGCVPVGVFSAWRQSKSVKNRRLQRAAELADAKAELKSK